MIQRDRPEGSDVWFQDERGNVRRGQLVRMTDNQVCLQIGPALLIVPRRRCYADKENALNVRLQELTDHIGTLLDVQRALAKELDPRPCRTVGVCYRGCGHCPHGACCDPCVTIEAP